MLKLKIWWWLPKGPLLNTYRENNATSSNTPQPTRLTHQQMDWIIEKGLCFSCDRKYSKGHKCGEKKLFYIYCEEE